MGQSTVVIVDVPAQGRVTLLCGVNGTGGYRMRENLDLDDPVNSLSDVTASTASPLDVHDAIMRVEEDGRPTERPSKAVILCS